MEILIILAIVAAIGLWAILLYNKLVAGRNMVKEGWSGIEVQLKRRANLIPNLVETVKGYAGHEQEALTKVTELRARSLATQDPGERGQVEGLLGRSLANLFAVAEAYPDLKANTNFLDLQNELSDIEEQIQLARRYYNGATRDFNNLVEQFPSNIIAGAFSFRQAAFFEIEDPDDRAVPEVSFSEA